MEEDLVEDGKLKWIEEARTDKNASRGRAMPPPLPPLDQAMLVTHHLFAGEHLRMRQGLAVLLPFVQPRLKLFQCTV